MKDFVLVIVILVTYEIIPLIREYWFDDEDKVELWSNKLRSVII